MQLMARQPAYHQGKKVLQRDAHGPVVVAKPPAFSFRPSAQVASTEDRPVPLSSLEVGDTFRCYWEGGKHPQGAEGVLLHLNASRARVRIHGKTAQRDFVEKSGAHRTFNAPTISDTDWSPGTLVIKTGTNEVIREKHEGTKGGSLPKSISFKPADQQPDIDSQKEDVMAAKIKGNGKSKAKASAEADNKCGCGCGTMVRRTFAQGHDARFYGWAKKVVSGDLDPKDLNAHARAQLKDKAAARKALASHGK